MMSRGIFITATDTGVGKTFVAAALLRTLKEQGHRVCPMKPFETGCRSRNGVLLPADAVKLMNAAGINEDLHLINPYRLRKPLAPSVAAELEGVQVKSKTIMTAYRRLSRKYGLLIVEGAGGIMVPLFKQYLTLDLIHDLALPVLIVARPGLGTLNHTFMTIAAARSRDVPVLGVVINEAMKSKRGLAEKTNPAVIETLGGVPVLGTVSYHTAENGRRLRKEIQNIGKRLLSRL